MMKVKILSVVSALLIAVLMFTCTAPAVIGETSYVQNPDQTDGEDEYFFTEDELASYGISIGAITGFLVSSVGISYMLYLSLETVTRMGVAGVVARGIGAGSFIGMALFALGYGIWNACH